MLAAIPEHEMAETLRVLAGTNASNAARHFGRQSHELGDIASAVLWSSIAQTLERMATAASEPDAEPAVQPVPRRMMQHLQDTAFEGVRFEDVEADTLVREALHETMAAITEAAAGEPKADESFQHAENGAATGAEETPERPHKLELVSARQPAASETPDPRASSPIWSRIAKRGSTRMAA